jgi:hypothetical protein
LCYLRPPDGTVLSRPRSARLRFDRSLATVTGGNGARSVATKEHWAEVLRIPRFRVGSGKCLNCERHLNRQFIQRSAKEIAVGSGTRRACQARLDGVQEQLRNAGMAEIVRVEAVDVADKPVLDLLG